MWICINQNTIVFFFFVLEVVFLSFSLIHLPIIPNPHHIELIYTTLLGEGNGTPLQYSCLENPMDGGAWWAAVHGVTESRTRLSDFTFTCHFHALRKWHPTAVLLPGESRGRGSLVGFRLWGRTESDTTEAT